MVVQEFLEEAQNMMSSEVHVEETSEDLEKKVKILEVRCYGGGKVLWWR